MTLLDQASDPCPSPEAQTIAGRLTNDMVRIIWLLYGSDECFGADG